MVKRLILLFYYTAFASVYAGFILHKSVRPDILQYSTSYFLLLLVLAIGFVLPPVVLLLLRKYGAKHIVFAALPVTLCLLVGYFAASARYYYTQRHPFDPYLQKEPPQQGMTLTAEKGQAFRILAIGGSTTESTKLAAKERYPALLQDLLREHYPASDIEVFNAGRGWYTTKHSLINYVTDLRDWQPDLVILMHAINDLYRSFSPPQCAMGDYNRFWSHFYGPSIRGAKPPTFEEHVLWHYSFAWYSQLRRHERDLPLARYVSLKDFEQHLRRFVHYVRSDQVPVILMTQPSLYKAQMRAEEKEILQFGLSFCLTRYSFFHEEYPAPHSLYRAMQAFNDVTRTVAQQEQVGLVDAAPQIAKDVRNFFDDVHYKTGASHKIASMAAQHIIEAGYIQ